jgi:hypothetical protein
MHVLCVPVMQLTGFDFVSIVIRLETPHKRSRNRLAPAVSVVAATRRGGLPDGPALLAAGRFLPSLFRRGLSPARVSSTRPPAPFRSAPPPLYAPAVFDSDSLGSQFSIPTHSSPLFRPAAHPNALAPARSLSADRRKIPALADPAGLESGSRRLTRSFRTAAVRFQPAFRSSRG